MVFNDTKGRPRFNISLDLNTDFVRSTTFFSLIEKSNDGSEKVGLKSSADTCNVSKGIFGNFIIQMIAKNLEKYSNFKFECVIVKGSYYVRNFPIDFDYVPTYFLSKSRHFELTATVKGKPNSLKSPIVHMFSFKFVGAFIM